MFGILKTNKPSGLGIPPDVAKSRDPKRFQFLSAWIADGELHASLDVQEDPKFWGDAMGDIVSHIALALSLDGSGKEKDFIEREVVAGIVERLKLPFDTIEGVITDKSSSL